MTTVFPRQGHSANDSKILAAFPAADITLDRIGDLLEYNVHTLVSAGHGHKRKVARTKARS